MIIGICDNNLAVADNIKERLESQYSPNIATTKIYSNFDALMFDLDTTSLDVVFMDIELDGNSGIKIAAELKKKFPDIQIIFTSAHDDYHLDVYEVSHTYFLKKPIDESKLTDAINKAISSTNKRNTKYLPIKVQNNIYKTPFSEIVYMEKVRRVVMIHLSNGTTYRTYAKFSDFLETLDDDFFQCHNSFLVNLNYIDALDNKKFVIKIDYEANNNTVIEIPVSKTYYSEAKERFINHLKKL